MRLVNFPDAFLARFGDEREVADGLRFIPVMIEEHNLPGNEGTYDGGTVEFVTRDIPIVDGVCDWETMRLPDE